MTWYWTEASVFFERRVALDEDTPWLEAGLTAAFRQDFWLSERIYGERSSLFSLLTRNPIYSLPQMERDVQDSLKLLGLPQQMRTLRVQLRDLGPLPEDTEEGFRFREFFVRGEL